MGGARGAICAIVCSLFITFVIADDSCKLGNEYVEFIYLGYRNKKIIDDNFKGAAEVITTKNIEEIKVENSLYFSFTLDKAANKITVLTTDEFSKYEEKEIGKRITVPMLIKCSNGQEYNISYFQDIKDINTYAPAFAQSEYEFTMYGYIPEDFSITNLISITATDMDCSPDELKFEIDSNDFYIGTASTKGKTTYVNIIADTDIYPPLEATYTIKVKDRSYDDDNKEATAKLKLKLLEDNIDFKFTASSYSATIEHATKKLNQDLIQFTNGLDENVNIEIEESEYSKYFSVKKDYVANSIVLKLDEEIPTPPSITFNADSKREFQLTLKANWHNKEATTQINVKVDTDLALQCLVPDIDINRASFTNPNIIDDNFVGTVFTIGKTANVDNMKCSESKYLKCTFDNGDFTVSTTSEFAKYEEFEFEDMLRLNLTIECPYDTKILEFRQKIKDINNHDPEFSKSEYNFVFYNEIPYEFDVTRIHDIQVKDLDLTPFYCNFYFDKDQTDGIFELGYGSSMKEKTCRPSLYLKKTINAPFQSSLNLYISDGEKIAKTKINLKVEKEESSTFKFTWNEFYMKFNNDSRAIIPYGDYEIPTLENGVDSNTKFVIDDEVYGGMITLKTNKFTGKVTVELKKHAQFSQDDHVKLPIKATWHGLETSAYLVIILNDNFHPPSTTSTTTISTTTDGFTTTTSSSIPTTTTSSNQTTTETIDNSDPVIGQLSHFNMFILLSDIGIIAIFVMATLVLSGAIYMLTKRFYCNREKPVSIVA